TSGDRGNHRLLIAPDGQLTPLAPAEPVAGSSARTETYGEEVSEEAPQPTTPDATDAAAAEPPSRPSFLGPAPDLAAGSGGWRRFAHRFGITIKPSAAERQRAEWTSVVSRQWAGCRTIAIANGKGGV